MKNKNIILSILAVLVLLVVVYYYFQNKNNVQGVINSNESTETNAATGTATKTTSTLGTTQKATTSNYIKIGQRTLINGVYITPTKVTYDGRCPTDVKCIQAGTVDLGVFLEEGTVTQDVIITLNRPILFAGKVGNKTVTLTNVYPSKTTTRTLKPSDYRFVITVK